jgi:hypothetical protein
MDKKFSPCKNEITWIKKLAHVKMKLHGQKLVHLKIL